MSSPKQKIPLFLASLTLLADCRIRTSDGEVGFRNPLNGEIVSRELKPQWLTLREGDVFHTVSWMEKGGCSVGLVESTVTQDGKASKVFVPVGIRTECYMKIIEASDPNTGSELARKQAAAKAEVLAEAAAAEAKREAKRQERSAKKTADQATKGIKVTAKVEEPKVEVAADMTATEAQPVEA